MKRLLSLFVLLATVSWSTWADETITVSANSEDISQALDLKAVATLFGTVKNVEEFETLLNTPDSAFTNLDLNGDGIVDYLRVVETTSENKHLVVIQAVLAKDVFQDVASIYVEKDERTGEVTTQVIGDEYIYGTNYIIEPVYIYRPYIYDWFWDPFWVAWYSPWYWGYYPSWWYGWHCWPIHHYWDHCYHWHHHHPYCSFRYASRPSPHYHDLRYAVGRRDYAVQHRDRSFAVRQAGVTNARTLDVSRATATRAVRPTGAVSRQGSTVPTRVGSTTTQRTIAGRGDNTFGSTAVRRPASTVTRPTTATGTRQAATISRDGRSASATVTRPTQTASVSRGTSATPTKQSPRSTGSSVSRSSASTSRPASSSYSGSRSSSSQVSRSSSSGSSSRSSGSYSSSSRSSGGFSSGGSSRSSGGFSSGGGSRSGGGFSGGGGHSSGGGGGRSGGGSTRR